MKLRTFCCVSAVVAMLLAVTGFGAGEEPIKIGAIFAITGPASFLGAPEAKTMEMLVEAINAEGGVNGKKLEVLIKDSGADPQKAVSLARQMIEEAKVLAIIGPSTSGESLQIKDLCEKNQTILFSCAAAELIVNPVAKYVFKSPQNDSLAARKIYEKMKAMGLKKVAVLSSQTGFGKAGKEQLEKLAGEYGIEIVANEAYDKSATDLSPVIAKVKDKNPDAVINWSIEPAQALVAKNMRQAGMTVPLFQSHGFGNISYVKAAGPAAEGIIFPCGRLLVADVLPDDHPQKSVLMKYKNDYESRYKEEVSTFGGHAYDALMILVQAIKAAGSDKEKVRDAIENTKGFVGTAGVFNFSAQDHNGLGQDAFEMLTVENGKFVLCSE